MKLLNSFMFRFCRNQAISTDKYFTDIKKLRRTLEREHFYVRKHYKQFEMEIQRCIQNRDWEILRDGLRCINIGQLDSWLTLRKIGKTFTQVINSLKIDWMSPKQLQSLLFCLNQLKYEPIPLNNQNNKTSYPYDDIENFTDQLKHYVESLQFSKQKEHFLQLAKNLIHTNPQLFYPKRIQLEKYLLNNLQQIDSKGHYILTLIISRGTIANYWSDQFKNKLVQRVSSDKNLDQIIQSFYFQKMSYPNQITPSNVNKKVKTQFEIANILQGYGYSIKTSVDINKYEVDVLINDFLVVEYNGHHHYVINSDQLIPTLKHQWKTQILKKRGFIISSISYPEWKEVHLFQQKRKFLVNKIENDLLKFYSL